jgi:hypothetical protein
MITNISDCKDTKFLSYNNTLSVEMKFHWQIIAFGDQQHIDEDWP